MARWLKFLKYHLNQASLRKIAANPRYLVDELNYQLTKNKKATLSYPPRSITVGIIGACYFQCSFCALHSPDARHIKATYKVPFRMPLEEFKKIVDWSYRGRIRHLHICGTGEPFLHTNILEMIDYSIQRYGKVSFQTDFGVKVFDDGYYLDEILKRKEYISYITTDILSADKAVHEGAKIGSDFDKLIEYLRYLSAHSDILIAVHHLLTHQSYADLYRLPQLLKQNNINFQLDVVNLHPYNFNQWTALDNVYTHKDVHITRELERLAQYCTENKIPYSIPVPFDENDQACNTFWARIQVMPMGSLPKERQLGNAIPSYCNAVVNGNLHTIGNILDYDKVMDFWNNPHLVTIRQNLINGQYPSPACVHCQNYIKTPQREAIR